MYVVFVIMKSMLFGKANRNDFRMIYRKNLIFFNCLSLLIPDLLYFRRKGYQIKKIPTVSHTIVHPIPRLIHFFFWYFGYFHRMKILTKSSARYSLFHYSQEIGWLLVNIFPEIDGITGEIHRASTIFTFTNFAIMKFLYCKYELSFISGFFAIIICYLKNYESLLGLVERYSLYHVVFTVFNK